MPVDPLPEVPLQNGTNASSVDLLFSIFRAMSPAGQITPLPPDLLMSNGQLPRERDLLYSILLAGLGVGPSTSLTSSSSAPASGDGSVGDFVIDTTTLRIYEKTDSTTWTQRGQLVPA